MENLILIWKLVSYYFVLFIWILEKFRHWFDWIWNHIAKDTKEIRKQKRIKGKKKKKGKGWNGPEQPGLAQQQRPNYFNRTGIPLFFPFTYRWIPCIRCLFPNRPPLLSLYTGTAPHPVALSPLLLDHQPPRRHPSHLTLQLLSFFPNFPRSRRIRAASISRQRPWSPPLKPVGIISVEGPRMLSRPPTLSLSPALLLRPPSCFSLQQIDGYNDIQAAGAWKLSVRLSSPF
jgi:hypothetical protein